MITPGFKSSNGILEMCLKRFKDLDLRKSRSFKGPGASSVYETWEERSGKVHNKWKDSFSKFVFKKKKRENVSKSKELAEKFISSLADARTRWFYLLLHRERQWRIVRFAVPHWGPVLQRKLLLNSQNDCWFSCHFSFCCFCQEHYSRLEEKFWDREIGNGKFDSLSSTCSHCGRPRRLDWFNAGGRPIHLPGGIRRCTFVACFTASVLALCTWTRKVTLGSCHSKEVAWGFFVAMEWFYVSTIIVLK